MFRPWLRVAVPDDWTGSLAQLGSGLLALLVLLGPLLGRIPDEWVLLARGHDWAVRAVVVVATAWILMQLRPLAYLPLPRTVVLLGGRLRVPGPLHSRWLKVDDIETIHVDEQPDGEEFTLAMRSGRELELCPVGWDGAGRLYVKLAARVARAHKRRRRDAIRRVRRDRKNPTSRVKALDESGEGVSLTMGPVTNGGGESE